METTGWYLMAYDIRDPTRLRKIHRALRRQAMPVQASVFLAEGRVSELRERLHALHAWMDTTVDDVRAWPVAQPACLWTYGASLIQGDLLGDGSESGPACERRTRGWRDLLQTCRDDQEA